MAYDGLSYRLNAIRIVSKASSGEGQLQLFLEERGFNGYATGDTPVESSASTTEWTYEKFGKYKDWSMECKCTSKDCRGTLGTFPTLSPKLKKKYYCVGALQDFILKKLEQKMFA